MLIIYRKLFWSRSLYRRCIVTGGTVFGPKLQSQEPNSSASPKPIGLDPGAALQWRCLLRGARQASCLSQLEWNRSAAGAAAFAEGVRGIKRRFSKDSEKVRCMFLKLSLLPHASRGLYPLPFVPERTSTPADTDSHRTLVSPASRTRSWMVILPQVQHKAMSGCCGAAGVGIREPGVVG